MFNVRPYMFPTIATAAPIIGLILGDKSEADCAKQANWAYFTD